MGAIKYPINFNVKSYAEEGIASRWEADYSWGDLELSVPREFEGPGGGASPEDLYALSLLNCFIATFKVYAEKSRLGYQSISGDAELVVDSAGEKMPWMSEVKLSIAINKPEDEHKAERILNKVKDTGMILNSVKSKLSISWTITK